MIRRIHPVIKTLPLKVHSTVVRMMTSKEPWLRFKLLSSVTRLFIGLRKLFLDNQILRL